MPHIFSHRPLILQLFWVAAFLFLPRHPDAAEAHFTDPAQALGFAPHKALYDIQLVGTKSGSQIVNISGQMFYEWQPGCEAWTSNHRFNILYEYADSAPMHITSDFSTYESFDGQTLDFSSRRKRDGVLFEELRGHGTLDDSGQGEIAYSLPKDLAFSLPKGTLFPTGHSMGVAQQIKDGQKIYNATIFDGSDEEGPVEVNTFIGKAINDVAEFEPSPNLDVRLLNTPAHQIRLAFFPLDDPSSTSDYEMNIVFHDNGIISDMIVEYDDFTISQKLVALESLPVACNLSKKTTPKDGK